MVIIPFVGLSSNPMICMRVDFPDPEGPKIAVYSPFVISKETSSRALNISPEMLYAFVTWESLIIEDIALS